MRGLAKAVYALLALGFVLCAASFVAPPTADILLLAFGAGLITFCSVPAVILFVISKRKR